MLHIGEILRDRYQLEEQLSENEVHSIWRAKDLAVEDTARESVLVKLLALGGNVQWDRLKLFEREAQILQNIDHPQIPKYRDYFSIDDRALWFCLVEDYIPGLSLKEWLGRGKTFTQPQVRQLAIALLKILIYLHELSPPVLHRDIKPSNIIIGEDKRPYLVDFGAVQNQSSVEGSTFTVVGSYGYTPMEQFGGRAVPASDLYALGATLIHLLTGTSPADLPVENFRLQFSHRANLSPDFARWLEKLIEPDLKQRFSSASEALNALKLGMKPSQEKTSHRAEVVYENNSGCGIKANIEVPEAIKGWNWGAFFLPYFWPLSNRVWIGLLACIPNIGWIMAFFLGSKGNEWAWKSRRWRSIEQFKAHQRGWAIAGMFIGIPMAWMYLFFLTMLLNSM